jgi:hypothetical protein
VEEYLSNGITPRVFSTNPDAPDEGRIFVWAWTEWFERLEGATGAVAFTPVAQSEDELLSWLSQQQQEPELTELDDDYGEMISEEFLEQMPLDAESLEMPDDELFTKP